MFELLIALIVWLAALQPDLDGNQCFEDEAVVAVVQVWDPHGSNQHIAAPVVFACVPVDDLTPLVP